MKKVIFFRKKQKYVGKICVLNTYRVEKYMGAALKILGNRA